MAAPTTNLKPFKPGEFFSDDDNRVKEFMNKPGVRDKIWQMSQKYGVSPNEIVYTIYKESAGSFSPQQPSSSSSAIGLFQILPDKGKNYRDFVSYEPWGEGLEGTEQWRMKDGNIWGKFPLVPGEQYSSKSGKGYQKGKRRFYMDDIAKMNELQQLELFDLYLGEKFRGSDYREGNVPKGKPGDIYKAVAWPDAIGAPGDEIIIEEGTDAYKRNVGNWGYRPGLFKKPIITPNSIKKFGGNQETWDSKFTNEELGYDENYVPVEDPYPYPQFRFDDEGRVTFEPIPESKPQPKPEQNISESVIDYSQFELPSFESDKTKVAPFNPIPPGGVGPWEMYMQSYKESGLPAEGFKEGGKVWKEGDAPIDFGMLPEITLTDRDPHRNKYSTSPMSVIRKNWAENIEPFGYGNDMKHVLNSVIQTGLGNPDTRWGEGRDYWAEQANNPESESYGWTRERLDLLNMLMGESQKYGSIPPSKYQTEGDPTTYYSSPFTKRAIDDLLFPLRLNVLTSDFTSEDLANIFAGRPIGNINKYTEEFFGEGENEFRVQNAKKIQEEFKNFQDRISEGERKSKFSLGNFSTDLKIDPDTNKPYIEYTDTWDLNPLDAAYETYGEKGLVPFLNNMLGRQKVDDIVTGFNKHILGMTPPKIRGRVYLKEGGQVIKNNDMKYNNYRYGGSHYGVPQYFLGGAFEKLTGKKFKETGFGKGLRDFGVASLNTLASPFESLMGTDFGIDEKFGYKTKFGEVYGGVGETAGSMLGQLAPTALNLVAPGTGTALSMVGQSLGGGLEGAGITQDISTDPQSAMGSQFGSMLNMMAMMNPSGGAGQVAQGMGQTGFMQQLASMLSGGQPTAKYGIDYKEYAQGGMASPDIEVESGEVINSPGRMRSFTPGAPLKSIGSGAVEVGGNISHEKGGAKIGLDKNAQVFSATLKPEGSKQTYAQHAKTLNQLIEKEEKNAKSGDFITRETAELNIRKHKQALQQLFASQQKQNKGNTNVMARQGTQYTVPPTSNPDSLGITSRDINLKDIIERMQQTDLRNRQLSTLEDLKTKGNIFSSPPFDPKIYTNSPANLPFRKGGLVKAVNGLENITLNPNAGSGGFGGMYGLGNQSGGFGGTYGMGTQSGGLNTNNPAFGNPFQLSSFQPTTFNTSSGGGLNTSTPSQYERVPFKSQYSGLQGMLPYAGSALNLGLGIAGLMNPSSIDASKYMINPELRDTKINKSAMLAPDMQAYTTAMSSVNDPRYKTLIHSNFMPQLAKRSEGIEFLQQKLKGENIDTINKFKGINAGTQYGVDMKNIELGALPWKHIGQATSDITSTAMQMGQNKGMEELLYNMYPTYRKVS